MSHSLPLPLDYHTKRSKVQPKSDSNQSQTGRFLDIQVQKCLQSGTIDSFELET